MRNSPRPQSTLADVLRGMSTKHILALMRVAKTQAYVFFRDPQDMITLRHEAERRTSK